MVYFINIALQKQQVICWNLFQNNVRSRVHWAKASTLELNTKSIKTDFPKSNFACYSAQQKAKSKFRTSLNSINIFQTKIV